MDIRRENGIALVVALMAMLLMTALGAALVLTTSTETIISTNFRNGGEGLYAADAVIERAMDDILTVSDWNTMLSGATQSGFVDGPPNGERTLPDGSKLDLTQAINMANCQKIAACGNADMDAITAERPFGKNNTRWQPYAYGKLSDMMPTDSINSPYYVILFVGDDGSEIDGDPRHDSIPGASGNGILALRAESFGPRGAHKVIETTIARTDTTELERGYTGQRGQDEQNRRSRKAAVGTPGKNLQQQSLTLASGGVS